MTSISLKGGWKGPQLKDRFYSAGYHLLVSVAIAAIITAPFIFWLYPQPFFSAAGGFFLMSIVVGVDIVIGPLLTFLTFDRRKKSLRMDLTIIGILQLVALFYGLYATSMSRPVFMTWVVDRYETVTAAQVDPAELKLAPSEFRSIKWGHPTPAFADLPKDANERNSVLFSSLNGIDLSMLFRHYQAHDLAKPQIIQRSQPIEKLSQFNNPEKVKLALSGMNLAALRFVPLQGKRKDLAVLVDAKSGDLFKVVDLVPWQTR